MSEHIDPFAPFQVADNEYQSIVFQGVTTGHYLPAIEEGIRRTLARVEEIKADPAPPDFANTVAALERASEDLDLVSNLYFVLFGAHGTPEHHALSDEISPRLARLESDLSLDSGLFARIQAVHERRDALGLDGESARLLEKTWRGFVRNGALLPPEKQERLRAIDLELSTLSPQFSKSVLKATTSWSLHLEREEDLAGLPGSAVDQMRAEAERRGLAGWVVTLHAPSLVPFLTYSARRDLREQVWRAHNGRAYGGELDNQGTLKRTVALRHERAALLGFAGHAEYVLTERMARDPDTVVAFLDRLQVVARPAAEQEVAQVRELARAEDGLEDFQPWDLGFYSEKLRRKLLDFDEEELRAYFPLEKVLEGMFQVAARLYRLQFEERRDLSVWHEDVRVFRVSRDGALTGLFYVDLFPRETKQAGAWQTTLRDQGTWRGRVVRPHVAIVCNFTPPAGGRPALLRLDEVRTLFHEFGHALHSLMSECRYQATGGTSVYWDFVELPSQIMENWIDQEEAMRLFAGHWETGDPVPAELIEKVRKARRFMAGNTCLRQLSFGYLDMAWHLQDPGEVGDVADFENLHLARARVLPPVPGAAVSPAFSHIFAGGYASGYYSYKWAEVLEADAFARFQEEGIFNPDTAESFRASVLSRGNSAHPMDLFVAFRGRRPDPDALLRRDGLLV